MTWLIYSSAATVTIGLPPAAADVLATVSRVTVTRMAALAARPPVFVTAGLKLVGEMNESRALIFLQAVDSWRHRADGADNESATTRPPRRASAAERTETAASHRF